jgi:Ca2+-binding RTX toxin-like protein
MSKRTVRPLRGEPAPRPRSENADDLFIPADGQFGGQWHLLNTGQTGGTAGIDINVTKAWDDYTGAGISVAVYDDGVDYAHADLNDNYDASRHLVIGGVVYDAKPANTGSSSSGGDTHGTAVAGLIAAENNGIGTVGAAFGADLTGVAILASSGAPGIVEAMRQQDNFDVVNHSWGFTTPFAANLLSPNADWQNFFAGLTDAVTNGRGGLGTIMVKAAGNSRQDGFETSYDNFTNSRFIVAVGAVDHKGQVSFYSTPGASLLVSAPSSGSGVGITTTDLAGASGDTPTDYRSNFGGTSAAAPLVSGVVALMLEANPDLGWRDVQEILAYSARHVGSAVGAAPTGHEWYGWTLNKASNWNGGGLHFSNDYGFGLVNAHAAVRLAETWTAQGTLANEQTASVSATIGAAIPDNDRAGVVRSLNLPQNIRIARVELVVDISHSARGDLKVALVSPGGTTSILLDRPLNGADDGDNLVFTLASSAFWGEASAGDWTVRISDEAAFDTGVVRSVRLKVYGDPVTADDTYVYTDEFAAVGAQPGRGTLSDTDGVDAINASAVTSNLKLDLRPGAVSTIAGRTVTIGAETLIENAYGGDGADELIGNAASNKLFGGRGDDRLDGGAGADRLDGGAGNDTYVLDDAGDGVIERFGGGTDTVLAGVSHTLAANVENLTLTGVAPIAGTGNELGNRIEGNGADNLLSGLDGDDFLFGGDGDDSLVGGAGKDRMAGGLGDDVYFIDGTGDVVVENAGEGSDTVRTNLASLLLGSGHLTNVENGVFVGTGNFSGTGSAAANRLVGGDGNDSLLGKGGDDLLVGGLGNDRLLGDIGSDRLDGGAGTDTLDGGAGADLMFGGLGNDTYIVDDANDVASEDDGDGLDTVRATIGFTLGAGLENLILGGLAGISGLGNALNNSITGNAADNRLSGLDGNDVLNGGAGADILEGGAGNDRLIGGADSDTLHGEAGDDSLDGGTGADAMAGGIGNDSYVVDNVGDTVTEGPGAGTDRVSSSISYALPGGVENLSLTGSLAIDGTGNDVANAIAGNAAANRLEGGAGNDSLSGLGGDDTLLGGIGNDSLRGADGADTLVGGTGLDSLQGGTGADRFIFSAGETGVTASTADKLLDFSKTDGDLIDLSAFDAVTATSGDEAFAFVGSAAFSKTAGELRVTGSGTSWQVSGDVNGDGVADFLILVTSAAAPGAADFIL